MNSGLVSLEVELVANDKWPMSQWQSRVSLTQLNMEYLIKDDKLDFKIKSGVKEALAVSLRVCVYIHIRQLSSFRAPTLWFIDLTVATCHIQYTLLSFVKFFPPENGQNTKYTRSIRTKMAANGY